jgi:hypothetical protein
VQDGVRRSPSFILQRGPVKMSQSSLERPALGTSASSGSLSRGLGVPPSSPTRKISTSNLSTEVIALENGNDLLESPSAFDVPEGMLPDILPIEEEAIFSIDEEEAISPVQEEVSVKQDDKIIKE